LKLTSDGGGLEGTFLDAPVKLDIVSATQRRIWVSNTIRQQDNKKLPKMNERGMEYGSVFFIFHRQTIIKKTRCFSFSSFKKL
jgi:hypothetical protein